jgi:hypothetical protein
MASWRGRSSIWRARGMEGRALDDPNQWFL